MSKSFGLTDGGNSISLPPGASDGLGSPLIRPIGISPSIGVDSKETWFRGNQWPPKNTEAPSDKPAEPWSQSNVKHFTPVTKTNDPKCPLEVNLPPRGWDPAFYQLVLLAEFAQNWKPVDKTTSALNDILNTALVSNNQETERDNLIKLIEFRAGLQDEMVAQMTTFDAYFQGALGYTPATHPCTNHLVQGAMRVAELAVMHYKNYFQRPRPWQLWPELMPVVQVPGHASFPSGHATQSNTIARVLTAVAAEVVPSVGDITKRLAQRIARGREVMGLHYPSDSEAGIVLSKDVADTYIGCPTVKRLVAAAQAEWKLYET